MLLCKVLEINGNSTARMSRFDLQQKMSNAVSGLSPNKSEMVGLRTGRNEYETGL